MAPCGWDVDLGPCTGMADHPEQTKVDLARDVAVETLWALSGRRYGPCEVTVRPRPVPPRSPSLVAQAYAHSRIGGGGPPMPIACALPARYITLPGPASGIVDVTIDGVLVDPTAYELNGDRLYRFGLEPWPNVQDMTAPAGQPGTWSVTYLRGLPVPRAGLHAAAVLACELFKAATSQACALPQRVTDITREGVSMTVLDPADFLDKGRTGITAVDQWLAVVNPHRLMYAPQVSTPDVPSIDGT